MDESRANAAEDRVPSRRARTITIGAIVTVLALVAGWVALAFTGDADNSSVDVVGESTLPGYPTRGPGADLEAQRSLVAAADEWRESAEDGEVPLPVGQDIELLWAGDVDATELGTSAVRSSFSAQLLILRSDTVVAALVRPLDGASSGDDTAFSVLGTASIARSRYERGFTVAKGVLLFNERMPRGASLETATFSVESPPSLSETAPPTVSFSSRTGRCCGSRTRAVQRERCTRGSRTCTPARGSHCCRPRTPKATGRP